MKRLYIALAIWLPLGLLFVGCRQAADQPNVKQYEITGTVIAVDKDAKTVTLDHEDIPGLMRAMQMEFKVDNPQVLEGIAVEDRVHGQLEVKSGDYTITDLTKQ
jgi:protein SCO1/2